MRKISSYLYLFALLITNIGNSASFIICGKYTYDYFGLAAVFGGLLVLESVQSIVLSGFAGHWVDRIGAKKVSVISDFLLFFIVACGAYTASIGYEKWSVVSIFLLINIIKPFQNTSVFVLPKLIVDKDSELYGLNAKSGMFFQLGYLIGLGITGTFVDVIDLSSIMLLDALTFLLSGFLIWFIVTNGHDEVAQKEQRASSSFMSKIKEYIPVLRNNYNLLLLCSIISIQVNLIIAYNTNLFKLVAENLNNNAVNLSILEFTYTIICICVSFSLAKFPHLKIKSVNLFYFVILQGVILFLLSNIYRIEEAVVLVVYFAFTSSIVFPAVFSSLYKSINATDMGKIGGIKSILQSLIAIPVLVTNSIIVDSISLAAGYIYMSILSLIGGLLVYLVYNYNSFDSKQTEE